MPAFVLLTDAASVSSSPARWFFFGFIALAVLGLFGFVWGMFHIKRDRVRITRTRNQLLPLGRGNPANAGPDPRAKIWARSQGVSAEFHESLAIRDLAPGWKSRNRDVIWFSFRSFGLALFVLSTFLAVGTGLLAYDSSGDGAGWVLIGFTVLFASVSGYQIWKGARNNTE